MTNKAEANTTAGSTPFRCIAFAGERRIASGGLSEVARQTKKILDLENHEPVLIFDETTSRLLEIDFRGTPQEVVNRLAKNASIEALEIPDKRGPGRPRLGVVAREVTLLPRHWDWLNEQPGGASVALRKLVEEGKRANQWKDRARRSQEAVHRFMFAMAGNLPGFEEASRAFHGQNPMRFDELIQTWPKDIRKHLKSLAATAHRDQAAMVEKDQPKKC